MLARAENLDLEAPYANSQSNTDYEEWVRMAWTKPQYKRGEVDRAGDFLVNEKAIAQTYAENGDIEAYLDATDRAYTIINNWRSSHSYPLQVVKMTLLTRAKRVDAQAIIAQRIKRLSSIEGKLRRNENMKLSQMQDLGGCRAVLGTPRRVRELVDVYEKAAAKNPRDRPEFVKKYDYIKNPKDDGYRSVHFVYKYRTNAAGPAIFNGLRIEMQLRSRLQHAWATAVETVSTFTGQALKSNIGDEAWKRFFALMGSAIALREGTPTIPNTPQSRSELKDELRVCAQQLDVQNRLKIYGDALQGVPGIAAFPDAKYFLLELDLAGKRIAIRGYEDEFLEQATNDYLAVEKLEKSGKVSDAVLVSVDSMANLRRAYPNYFLDTRVFVDAVNKAIDAPPILHALRALK
jgi:ppGpp synthetase/RelA/SpoT-type nucleotidyltranferase